MNAPAAPIRISAAAPGDLAPVLDLLARNRLPHEALADHVATAFVARDGDRLIGSAALELYGDEALLRSVAVEQAYRGRRVGHRLTEEALAFARQRGVRRVYLLTETAGGFFPRFGFRPVSRAEVAAAVQQSVEFTTACPASALVMVAELEG